MVPPDSVGSAWGLIWRHPWLVSPLIPTPLLLTGLGLGPIVARLIRVDRGLIRAPAIPSIGSIISHFNCFSSKFEQKASRIPCGAGGLCSACFGIAWPSWDHHSVPFDWEWIRLRASGTVSSKKSDSKINPTLPSTFHFVLCWMVDVPQPSFELIFFWVASSRNGYVISIRDKMDSYLDCYSRHTCCESFPDRSRRGWSDRHYCYHLNLQIYWLDHKIRNNTLVPAAIWLRRRLRTRWLIIEFVTLTIPPSTALSVWWGAAVIPAALVSVLKLGF